MGMRDKMIALDKAVMRGRLMHWYHALTLKKTLNDKIDYRYIVHYNKDPDSVLSGLCDTYGSDKGELKSSGHPYFWASHTYADFYSELFDHCRPSITRVFECGLGTNNPGFTAGMGISGKPGASLRAWRDYFPNAEVYGADIDKSVLFQEDRIKTYYLDQTSPALIANMWSEIALADFDLIIDDGLHTFDAGVCLFEHSFDNLRLGGIYIIEDVTFEDFRQYQRYFAGTRFKVRYVNLLRPENGLRDNSMIVIRKTEHASAALALAGMRPN